MFVQSNVQVMKGKHVFYPPLEVGIANGAFQLSSRRWFSTPAGASYVVLD